MSSYKLNFARVRGCPAAAKLAEALESFGLPDDEEFGVLNCSANDTVVLASISRRTKQAVQTINRETREVTSSAVEKVTVYPVAIKPKAELMEIYAGSAAGIEQVGAFLAGGLGLSAVVEEMELDVADAIEKLAKNTQKFQLRSVRVSDYAANSYMIGPYSPKFTDTQHGMDFLEEYAAAVTSAQVRFQSQSGKATATLTPRACLSYSCQDEDSATVQAALRKLI
ncbi:MAG: hypothetical protein HZA50_13410 [Planctomycetes bacterium]|nr:hypothetical protein [Planctomycetota bacterium]